MSAFDWSLRAELGRNTKMQSSVIEPGMITTAIWEKADALVAQLDAQLTGSLRDRYGFLLAQQRPVLRRKASRRESMQTEWRKAVEHALTARRPKARYLVGPDAR